MGNTRDDEQHPAQHGEKNWCEGAEEKARCQAHGHDLRCQDAVELEVCFMAEGLLVDEKLVRTAVATRRRQPRDVFGVHSG